MKPCEHCGSEKIVRKGKTIYQGSLHYRFRCSACEKPFYIPIEEAEDIIISKPMVKSPYSWDKAKIEDDEAKHGNIPEIGLSENLQGLEVTGVTYLKKDENNVLHWIKTKAKRSEASMLEEFSSRLCERVPAAPVIACPDITVGELLTQYTISDLHCGMYSWARETGADWDLKICYDLITKAMNMAIDVAPDSEIGMLLELGDLTHYDGHSAVTPTSGNVLDADGRFSHMLNVSEDIILETIDKLLAKHKYVKVIIAQGNHDLSTSDTLRHLIRRYYRRNDRLEVIGGPNPFYAYQHGKTMIGAHHGHSRKRATLPSYFSQCFAEMWGKTEFRYLHVGHLHQYHAEEKGGAVTIQHSTLAAAEAYAACRYDKSHRAINTITYSDKFGMLAQAFIPVEMVLEEVA